MKRVLLLFIACTGLSLFLSAQRKCGFDEGYAKMLNNNPGLAQLLVNERIKMLNFIANHPQLRTQSTIDTIPVVVHIMHNGDGEGTEFNRFENVIIDAIE